MDDAERNHFCPFSFWHVPEKAVQTHMNTHDAVWKRLSVEGTRYVWHLIWRTNKSSSAFSPLFTDHCVCVTNGDDSFPTAKEYKNIYSSLYANVVDETLIFDCLLNIHQKFSS